MFSVRSAYHLAVQVETRDKDQVGSSTRGDGSRHVLNEVWSSNVPTKVIIFAWRLATDDLATQENRRRTLERVTTCQVCGMADETDHHAIVRCMKVVALRNEMRKHWILPPEELFRWTGPDWLILLLSRVNEDEKALILLLLWRAWYHRNDIMHDKGQASIAGSRTTR
jgi:hypothetical protein